MTSYDTMYLTFAKKLHLVQGTRIKNSENVLKWE